MSLERFNKSLLFIICMLMLIIGCIPTVIAKEGVLEINKGSCIKCHKRNGKMLGLHANNALGIQCQSCHGEKGKHPRKPSSLVRFGIESSTVLNEQREACMACHDHETLSHAEWTHDVHANQLSCAACHELHKESDPMLVIEPKKRSQLCKSCHSVNGGSK